MCFSTIFLFLSNKIVHSTGIICYIRSLGFEQFRVRLQDGIARIELRPADIQKFIENGIKDKVSEKLHALGFKYVSLDLDGYRLGSMNEVLNRQERGNNGGSSL